MTGDGSTELRVGRWSAARAAFERELATERTPEALEGLSWAAWWLDDKDAVFAAREAAFDLYRRAGRPAAAARMATWLAAVLHASGRRRRPERRRRPRGRLLRGWACVRLPVR